MKVSLLSILVFIATSLRAQEWPEFDKYILQSNHIKSAELWYNRIEAKDSSLQAKFLFDQTGELVEFRYNYVLDTLCDIIYYSFDTLNSSRITKYVDRVHGCPAGDGLKPTELIETRSEGGQLLKRVKKWKYKDQFDIITKRTLIETYQYNEINLPSIIRLQGNNEPNDLLYKVIYWNY